jgi:hypothetical protein
MSSEPLLHWQPGKRPERRAFDAWLDVGAARPSPLAI